MMLHSSPALGDDGKMEEEPFITVHIRQRPRSTSQKGGVGSVGLLCLLWSQLLRKGIQHRGNWATQSETNECLAEKNPLNRLDL